MSPPRRRSARLASVQKTPKASTPQPNLASLDEQPETAERDGSSAKENGAPSSPPPRTPAKSTPPKPPMSEMHPSKVHPSMTSAPSSALRLGFSDIRPAAGPAGRDQPSGAAQDTPSKTKLPSSPFSFRFSRANADMGLSGNAQRMMEELREEALKIKADLIAKREQEKLEEEQVKGRKIAHPKGKAGRYSAVHMAEFKKMDSIENHPSAFRAQAGRFTPLTKGVKRTQSRANLDEPDTPRNKAKQAAATPAKRPNPLFNRGCVSTSRKPVSKAPEEPISAVKRMKQHIGNDVSSSRPVSRDGSFLPRPTTATGSKEFGGIPRSQTLESLMTPTKSSVARSQSTKTPTKSGIPITPSMSSFSSLKRSATTNSIQKAEEEVDTASTTLKSPGRLDRVKSILRGRKIAPMKSKSALPLPAGPISKTPMPPRVNKALPSVPLTTPGRKLVKRVDFTPDTKRAAILQNSPSPVKSTIQHSPSPIKAAIPKSRFTFGTAKVEYPTLDAVLRQSEEPAEEEDKDVVYPDLSAHRPLPVPPKQKSAPEPTVPGTFTFRSDHTIDFGDTSPSGFGASPGQSSVRHVRPSIMPTMGMPGSFPLSVSSVGSNKENKPPVPSIPAAPHGLPNKKRHRAAEDDDDEEGPEADERAAKKRRADPVPEGEALLAPRLMAQNRGSPQRKILGSAKKPSQIPGFAESRTPSPVKKKAVLSLSRLNMLARPKMRK
ncbi:uncharacterized protein E0L32_005745 [Thyridium curvatum]|uniref:Erythromycin esterase n=1 Tax=Thyridium curvatum TaxID=1093900 RepID=A0A507B9R1_9PEZI|nr:uncharacterized protein E0L32_005745 [Thyridium curvatum]TPX13801.1 hypothetical protein E0L32_005745 [Thyridium curvatum]